MSDCRVCSTPDDKKPQIFRGEDYCCDRHRKVIAGEVPPTHDEKLSMDRDLLDHLIKHWKLGPPKKARARAPKYPAPKLDGNKL